MLFKSAMRASQRAGNSDKIIELGRKGLALDADDPELLVTVASEPPEKTRDTDLDKDQRLDEAMKMAQKSLQSVDTDISIPPNTPQEQVDAYKGQLRSFAYSIIGTLEFKKDNFTAAETDLRKSVDAYPSQPDPVVVLRLAISLDRQGKYPEALKEANHAVELTQEATSAGKLARQERDRLNQLVGGNAAAPNQPPPISRRTDGFSKTCGAGESWIVLPARICMKNERNRGAGKSVGLSLPASGTS